MSWADAWPAAALLLAIAALPWLVRWAKDRGWIQAPPHSPIASVLSVAPLGPHQKVVALEVKHGTHHRVLLLGVTAQSVRVLDAWPSPSSNPTPHAAPDSRES